MIVIADKHGCVPEACQDLVQFVTKECRHLAFCGLMTIGRAGYNAKDGPNPDFMVHSPDDQLHLLHSRFPLKRHSSDVVKSSCNHYT